MVNLTERRTAAKLPGDGRPWPTVDQYDALLLLQRQAGSS